MTYSEKLQDPRWKKRREEIKKRDNYTCRKCGQNRGLLHVHHKEYLNSREPWEYADEFLITLCASCHENTHFATPSKKAIVIAPERPRLSVASWTKEQRRRLWTGILWINKNMVSQSHSLRMWILENGTERAEVSCELVESFVEKYHQ